MTTGVISAAFGIWRFTGSRRVTTVLFVGFLAGIANYLWRASTNMPRLNRDGISGFSANDLIAPVVVFVVLSVSVDRYPRSDRQRFGQARAAATVAAFVVNVITI